MYWCLLIVHNRHWLLVCVCVWHFPQTLSSLLLRQCGCFYCFLGSFLWCVSDGGYSFVCSKMILCPVMSKCYESFEVFSPSFTDLKCFFIHSSYFHLLDWLTYVLLHTKQEICWCSSFVMSWTLIFLLFISVLNIVSLADFVCYHFDVWKYDFGSLSSSTVSFLFLSAVLIWFVVYVRFLWVWWSCI